MHFYPFKVTALKQKIEETQGSAFPAAGLKLIYAGKGMTTLLECNPHHLKSS